MRLGRLLMLIRILAELWGWDSHCIFIDKVRKPVFHRRSPASCVSFRFHHPFVRNAWRVAFTRWGGRVGSTRFAGNTVWMRAFPVTSQRERHHMSSAWTLAGGRQWEVRLWDKLLCPQGSRCEHGWTHQRISQADGVCTGLWSISWRFVQLFQAEAAYVYG